jgi:hypothetical protein
MKEVDLSGFEYIGGDIVQELIDENSKRYTRNGISFQRIDIINGNLPRADIVFCRDCLVHFSHTHIASALANIRASGAKWLMTTHFPKTGTNDEIITGRWRALDFEKPPFHFPPPYLLLRELSDPFHTMATLSKKWPNKEEAFSWIERGPDKSLAVWPLSELPI